MSRTPAASLARLKATYQEWWVGRGGDSSRPFCWAIHRTSERKLRADTPALLEVALFKATERRGISR